MPYYLPHESIPKKDPVHLPFLRQERDSIFCSCSCRNQDRTELGRMEFPRDSITVHPSIHSLSPPVHMRHVLLRPLSLGPI
uniref:Uncharacterized protein n=1 Tax=Arundo donax TaxID=35708 RepID=A0A0A9DIL1_ARUDO